MIAAALLLVLALVSAQPVEVSSTGAPSSADPDLVAQTLSVSSSSTADSIRKLVRAVAVDLKTEFSRETVATRVQLLVQIATSAALPAEAAGDALLFLHETVAKSLQSHTWTYDQLDATRDGAHAMFLLLDRVLASLVGSDTLTLTEATRARQFCSVVVRSIVRQSVADSLPFRFGAASDSLLVRVSAHSRQLWPASPSGGSDFVDVRQLDAVAAAHPTAAAVATIAFGHALYGRAISVLGAVAVEVFDANGAAIAVAKLAKPVRFTFALQPSKIGNRTCAYWDTLGWATDGCTRVESAADAVDCECTHLRGDFAVIGALPSGQLPMSVPPTPTTLGGGERYLWLLLVLLLLLCVVLLILFYLVRRHRQKKPLAGDDTLAPYVDKAAGMGSLALLGSGDISESSERERRDYALPVGTYKVPDETESSDLRRDDFSWALDGESESIAAARGRRGGDDASDSSEIGRNDTYKASTRLRAADATASTKRDALSTNIDLSRSQSSADDAAAAAMPSGGAAATEKEMKREARTETNRND